jgi:hypothetical protein
MCGAEGRPCAVALDDPASPSCAFGRMTAHGLRRGRALWRLAFSELRVHRSGEGESSAMHRHTHILLAGRSGARALGHRRRPKLSLMTMGNLVGRREKKLWFTVFSPTGTRRYSGFEGMEILGKLQKKCRLDHFRSLLRAFFWPTPIFCGPSVAAFDGAQLRTPRERCEEYSS